MQLGDREDPGHQPRGTALADEQLWPVPSLDSRRPRLGRRSLFVERAQAVAPGISLAGREDAVVEICRRLDGIPLAIELAASRMLSMTVIEVRDRLDDRFRLLVGARRGLERHQTLRHAVQWSYDLLDDSEKALLARCSVFAGGFDLAGACAVAGSDDEFATLDMLDSLVRKSLLVADRSSGRTRFSMLETIRQFAEEQLVATGDCRGRAHLTRPLLRRTESDVLALWDSPRQRDSYDWFDIELPNLRGAFRWAADHDDLDSSASIAVCAALLGICTEHFEPVAWAEELIERAEAVGHRRLAQLYVMAVQCYASGRVEDFVDYSVAGQAAVESGRFDKAPGEIEATLGVGFIRIGEPERWAQVCRNLLARNAGADTYAQACLVYALTIAGEAEEAVAESRKLTRRRRRHRKSQRANPGTTGIWVRQQRGQSRLRRTTSWFGA